MAWHHGADADLRTQVLPLFERYGVNAVFSGHEHVYQRIKPENNIYYFVLGNSGKLMSHDFGEARDRVKGFDSDQSFMLVGKLPGTSSISRQFRGVAKPLIPANCRKFINSTFSAIF